MDCLIDTHTFLWFVSGSKELTSTARALIEDEQNEIYISIASLWEISIKTANGKLEIEGGFGSVIDDIVENAIEILPINFSHTLEQNRLEFHHRDPFDRMIVSQARVEEMNLVSSDAIFDRYLAGLSISRIW
jgi:PIN domain nuclease of toxin-antitoxin system